MNENMKKRQLIFETEMKVEFARQKSIDDPTTVKTKGREDNDLIDILKESVALHIGKSDPHQDAVLSFPACDVMIQAETKFTEVQKQTSFSGDSKGTFQHEQEMALLSPCKLKNTYFLFITNGYMTEKEKESIVKEKSMFVNQQRWTEAFSPMFDFIKDV
jgi:hypothetical protein